MPLRKVRDLHPQEVCTHPEHEPPSHIVLENGVYEYVCPSCGRRLEFFVRRPTYLQGVDWSEYYDSGIKRLRKRQADQDPRLCGHWKDPHAIG